MLEKLTGAGLSSIAVGMFAVVVAVAVRNFKNDNLTPTSTIFCTLSFQAVTSYILLQSFCEDICALHACVANIAICCKLM